jgi:DNA-binding transcriptional MerR regulator
VSTRTYLSIGDVLSLLRQEFPDITISKIRFLESQGLVNPERSPSGYRKFYEHDVERLRWVLRQQREHFLPLKVIRDRLARNGDISGDVEDFEGIDQTTEDHIDEHEDDLDGPTQRPADQFVRAPEPAVFDQHAAGSRSVNGSLEPEEVEEPQEWVDPPSESRSAALAAASPLAARGASVKTAQVSRHETEAPPAKAAAAPAPAKAPPAPAETPAPRAAKAAETPAPRAAKAAAREPNEVVDPGAAANITGASLTLDELCAASGLAATEVASLEGFGLIEPLVIGGALYYDEEGLTVAKLVADFARFGIEPRHLRLFRNAVDRELGLIEQVVTPFLRQRNPEARQRAVDASNELSRLGQSLRAAILRKALFHHLGG